MTHSIEPIGMRVISTKDFHEEPGRRDSAKIQASCIEGHGGAILMKGLGTTEM